MSKLKHTVFNLAFLLTRDNTLIDKLSVFQSLVEYVQLIAFCTSPAAGWNLDVFWTVGQVLLASSGSFGVLAAFVVAATVVFAAVALVLIQMHTSGGHARLEVIKLIRLCMALQTTILLFPALHVFTNYLIHPSNSSLLEIALGAWGLFAFFVPVFITALFWFDPDPSNPGKATRVR